MPSKQRKPIASDEIALVVVAHLHTDGHLSNVLTHIAAGDWDAIAKAIAVMLERGTRAKQLSKLARNLLELICDDAGPTGRLMRPFFFRAIARFAGQREADRLEEQVRRLRNGMSRADRPRASRPRAANSPPVPPVRGRRIVPVPARPETRHDVIGARP